MDKKVKIALKFDKFNKLHEGKCILNIYIWSIDGTKCYPINISTGEFNKLVSSRSVIFSNITEFEERK